MVSVWISVILSSFLISLISLIGVVLAPIKFDKLRKILIYFVSFSAGALLGGAFYHLLPEIINEIGFGFATSTLLIGGILLFFILEKVVHWHHTLIPYHKEHVHPLAIMSLVGGSFHNFLDGLIIAGSFLVSVPVGISISAAVALHKIPKEIGWFGILVHGGFSKRKALIFNYFSSLFTIVGAIVALIASSFIENIQFIIIPLSVGGFIYLAGSNLIPELHKEVGLGKAILQLIAIIAGLTIMALLLLI